MAKPRGKTPSLLSMSTGAPVLHTCGKATKCDRCSGRVTTGQACFQIPKLKNGFTTRPIFCVACTVDIIAQTKAELANVERQVNCQVFAADG